MNARTHRRSSHPPVDGLYVTAHAVDRYRLHHDGGSWKSVLRAWDNGIEIEPQTAQFLAGRESPRKGSRYRLTPDRRGMLVVEPGKWGSGDPWVVVTYLRFAPSQEAFAWEHWPM